MRCTTCGICKKDDESEESVLSKGTSPSIQELHPVRETCNAKARNLKVRPMTIVSKLSRPSLLLVSVLLAGCMNREMTPVATDPDLVSTRIAQSAERASKALDVMSGIEQMRAPAMPQAEDYSSAPAALTQPITVRWSGPIEQMAETLAARAGMRFQTVGARAAVPVLVSVDVYQKPLIEVLHDLGLQAGRRADLSVNSFSNTVEIRYAPVDRT